MDVVFLMLNAEKSGRVPITIFGTFIVSCDYVLGITAFYFYDDFCEWNSTKLMTKESTWARQEPMLLAREQMKRQTGGLRKRSELSP